MEYFELNINGEYVPKWNSCVPNQEALDVQGGCVSDVSYKEFYVTTTEGKMVGYGERVPRKLVKGPEEKPEKNPHVQQKKLEILQNEVDELEASISNLQNIQQNTSRQKKMKREDDPQIQNIASRGAGGVEVKKKGKKKSSAQGTGEQEEGESEFQMLTNEKTLGVF